MAKVLIFSNTTKKITAFLPNTNGKMKKEPPAKVLARLATYRFGRVPMPDITVLASLNFFDEMGIF